MVASHASSRQGTGATQRWLLLIHHLPPTPGYLRVKVRRRLQQVGAVALKNSVYVLPASDEALEDFQWVRREIVDLGGEATVCTSAFVAGMSDPQIEDLLRTERNAEYDAVRDAARALKGKPSQLDVQRLRRQLRSAQERDHLGAPARSAAERAVRLVEAKAMGVTERRPKILPRASRRPRGAVWVTRTGVHVDRIASAWLIQRFVDARARFKFTASKSYRRRPHELRFDMFDGEFTHEGDRCTFETLCLRFGVTEGALQTIGEIVHDIDCKDDRFGHPETEGIATLLRGIALRHPRDRERLAAGRSLFDALYEQFSRSV